MSRVTCLTDLNVRYQTQNIYLVLLCFIYHCRFIYLFVVTYVVLDRNFMLFLLASKLCVNLYMFPKVHII